MTLWIAASRGLIGVLGVVAVLLAAGNLVTGGGSITDPAMPGGIVVGLLTLGAAVWTTASGVWRAVVVWLGVLAIVAVLVLVWVNVGDIQLRDLLVYLGVPALIVLGATLGLVIGRWRAGPLGTSATSSGA